jgi:hypothetical protein
MRRCGEYIASSRQLSSTSEAGATQKSRRAKCFFDT